MSPREPGARPTRVARVALVVALLVVALPLGTVPTAGPPRAAAAAAPVTLSVDTLEPGVATPGSTLTVRGRVANRGKQGLRDVEVRLRLSATMLGSRSELAAVAAGRTTSRDGEVVVARSLPDVGVGETEAFDLTRSTDELAALAGFGVYVLGVEVLASRSSGFGRVAIVRTLLPWVAEADLVPTGFSWLWPLAARPTRLADGVFANDSLAEEIGPDGRLTRLLEAGATLGPPGTGTDPATNGAGITWAIDPELVAAVSDMADGDGYLVQTRDGDAVPGGGGSLAIRWLETLRAATAGAPVLPLPYGDVDVTAVNRAGLGGDVTLALDTARTALTAQLPAATLLTDVAWPANGFTDRSTLALLRRSEVAAVVLDGRAVPPALDLSYTPTGRSHLATPSGRLAGLLADPGLADLLRARVASPLLGAQRLLAETAMIAAELPSGPSRSLVLMPPRHWDPSPAYLARLAATLPRARWATPVSLGELAGTPPPEVDRARLTSPREQRAAELPASYLAAITGMHSGINVFAAILTDRSAYIPGLDRSVHLLESTWWRDRPGRANRLARERDYLAELRGAVRVQPGNFTFSSRTGTIALTVANGLDQEVVLSLRLSPQTTRLRIEPTAEQTIGPRSKTQVEVKATAVAPGPVIVDATLRTLGGAAYGQPVQLRITITEYGTVALYITLGAAAVLFLAAGVRVVRRVLAAGQSTEEPGP